MNIRFLDGLRGIAAAIVMLGHARLLLWEGYSTGFATHPEQYSSLDKAMMYGFGVFRYGHEMVVLFFILSGFVIHLRYANREKRNPMQLTEFWSRRAKRLYPPLIFTLLLAFLLDSLGKSYGWGIYSQATQYANINRDVVSVMDLQTLIGNLLFTVSVYAPPFGTTVVTWSLMYEWWFYVCYPVFYFIALRWGFWRTTGFVAALFGLAFYKEALAPLLFWKVMGSFFVWWLGVCLVELWRNRNLNTFRLFEAVPMLSVFLIVALAARTFEVVKLAPFMDLIWGLGFMGAIGFLLQLESDHVFIRFLAWFKPLGDCSYTLYLIHFTIFCFVSGWLMSVNGGHLPQHHFWVIGLSAAVTVLAYGLHFLIEKPFMTTKPRKVQVLQPITTEIRTQNASLKTEPASLKTESTSLKTDLASLKTDPTSLKTELASLKIDPVPLKIDLTSLKTENTEGVLKY
jgi:peptidoglycan/LPS O-acetylase OafA/YrhL